MSDYIRNWPTYVEPKFAQHEHAVAWELAQQLAWLRQSIACGHVGQAKSEARDIVRYCRAILREPVQVIHCTCSAPVGTRHSVYCPVTALEGAQ